MTYGFSQWVQDVAGYSSDQAGYLQLPAALVAGLASVLVARRTTVRGPLVIAATVPVLGGLLLLGLHTGSPIVLLALAPALFGIPQALASVSNQAALYRIVPPESIGTAAGLSRTSVYIGAIAASSLIGGVFGQAPTTPDLHVLGWVIVGIAVVLSALTIGDRALRRGAQA
jgi:MFS family permease